MSEGEGQHRPQGQCGSKGREQQTSSQQRGPPGAWNYSAQSVLCGGWGFGAMLHITEANLGFLRA